MRPILDTLHCRRCVSESDKSNATEWLRQVCICYCAVRLKICVEVITSDLLRQTANKQLAGKLFLTLSIQNNTSRGTTTRKFKGELSPNFTFREESARGYWNVVTQNIREIGERKLLEKTMQSCLCTVQVRCDVVSFGTISVRYEKLAKQKIVCAGQPWVLSSMCTHSGTICPSFYGSPVRYQVLRDVTRHFNRPFGNLPGFKHRRVIHQKNFRSSSIILATLNFWWEFPFNVPPITYGGRGQDLRLYRHAWCPHSKA